MRLILFIKGGYGSGNHNHKGRKGLVGGSASRTADIRYEKRKISDLYRFTLNNPLATPDSALAIIRAHDLEVILAKGPAIENADGEIVVKGNQLQRMHGTKRGYGLAKIIWKHGERSSKKGTNLQVTRGDILR